MMDVPTYSFGGILADMETMADRIMWLASEMGLNKTQFGKLIGKPYKDVHAWTQGRRMDVENLMLVCEKTGASMDWLVLGRGDAPKVERIDPSTLCGAEIKGQPEVARDSSEVLPAKLVAFFELVNPSREERLRLQRLAASDGNLDLIEELRRIRLPVHKRTDAPKIVVHVEPEAPKARQPKRRN